MRRLDEIAVRLPDLDVPLDKVDHDLSKAADLLVKREGERESISSIDHHHLLQVKTSQWRGALLPDPAAARG